MDVDVMARLGERLRAGETLAGDELGILTQDVFGSVTLGLSWDEVSLERAVAHIDPDARHHQPYGLVHGGVWCAIVESMASVAGALHTVGSGRVVVGVSNATDFLRPHRTGRVDAVAEPLHLGRGHQLWQVVLSRTIDGKAVARGQVRLQSVDPTELRA